MAQQTVPNSGLWSTIANMLNDNFSEVYQNHEYSGIYDYNHGGADLNIAAADVWYSIENDGAGAFTNTTYGLSTVADIWNTSTNLFDFSGLAFGDSIDFRIDLDITTTAPNQEVGIDLFLATSGSAYQIPFLTGQQYKTAGTHRVVTYSGIYVGDANTRDNPGVFKIRSSDLATVAIAGWYAKVTRRGV